MIVAVYQNGVVIIQYKPPKCTIRKLVFFFFDVFYMFRNLGFIFGKTVIYTGSTYKTFLCWCTL